MLRIGIPSRFDYPAPDRRPMLGPKTYSGVEQEMLDYVARAGALPVMLPPLPEEMEMVLLEELDGLLLQGGSDVASSTYNEAVIEEGRWPGDPERDAFELQWIGRAMEKGIPILGICRGSQILNVFFGGTLYQDLQTQYSEMVEHRSLGLYDRNIHGIRFAKESLMARLHQNETVLRVNSVHHQGIQTLGDELEAQAWCPEDELIEAYVWKGSPEGKVMGVQWHPEFFESVDVPLLNPNLILEHWIGICRENSGSA